MRLSLALVATTLFAGSGLATAMPEAAAEAAAASADLLALDAAAASSFIGYTRNLSVFNADCSCKDHRWKTCIKDERHHIQDGVCYQTWTASWSIMVYDPILHWAPYYAVCHTFSDAECKEYAGEASYFIRNKSCGEPTGGSENKFRSYKCYHAPPQQWIWPSEYLPLRVQWRD